jgi:hypothetical protein
MDVVMAHGHPEVNFIETFLHEDIHYAIHENMGEDKARPELTWLDELAATITGKHAILEAAREVDGVSLKDVTNALAEIQSKERYGPCATAVLNEATNPLVAWRAWEKIFALEPETKKNYARERVIVPILKACGWDVEFPFRYGDRSVNVFV